MVESRDFELVVVAVSILTRTGGNLAEVLHKIAQQIQERRLARKAVLAGCYGAVGLAWVWIRTMMRMEVD